MANQQSWRQAWEHTLTGANSFYREHPPANHFTTSVTFNTEVGSAITDLITGFDDGTELIVTDVGAGAGQLTQTLADRLGDRPWISFEAIDLRPAPERLPPTVGWTAGDARAIALQPARRVVIAHEFLDDIPCERFEVDEWGEVHLVVVVSGESMMGPRLADDIACAHLEVNAAELRNWLDTWWPARRPFMRGEFGNTRDATWQHLTGWITDGIAIAIDYGHLRAERAAGTWDGGTLTGFRAGRAVSPIPDGSCNITAHVAMDAVAAARLARESTVQRQAEVLRGGHVAKPGGLGDFLWLTQEFSVT